MAILTYILSIFMLLVCIIAAVGIGAIISQINEYRHDNKRDNKGE